MLFDVAALLSTSASLGIAVEVFPMPTIVSISANVRSGDPIPPITITSGSSPVDPSAVAHGTPIAVFEVPLQSPQQVRELGGISFVRGLAGLSAEQIDKLVTSDPAVITRVLSSPPSASDAKSLWSQLTTSTRSKLIASAPRLVGNLNGFPVSARNTANRLWAAEEMATLRAKSATASGRALAESDEQKLHMLTRVEKALKKTKNGPERVLLSLDLSGQGKAVIVLGNLQTADYVTYMVPGMFYNVDGQVGAWTGDAADLYKQQVSWLHRLSSVTASTENKSVAVVAWLGYQTPDLTNIASLKLADQARDALSHDIEGMQTLRAGHLPYTTVVAHSYGSTAALMALTQYDFTVNALVLVGTPGSAAQSAKDLHVKNANVWVGAAPWDPVPTSAFFGSDPSAPSYGAHTLGVNGGTDVITGDQLGGSIGHNEYFDPKTESVRNMALIAIDQSQLVMQDNSTDATRTLADAR